MARIRQAVHCNLPRMSLLSDLEKTRALMADLIKYAFQPPPGPPGGNMPQGQTAPIGAPPAVDPSQGQPMPPGPPPGDPSQQQGPPPGDPSQQQGPPPGDPSQQQGPPPGDPSQGGGAPPPGDPSQQQGAPPGGGIDPNQLAQVLQQLQQTNEKTLAIAQRNEKAQETLHAQMAKTREEFAVVRAMSQQAMKALQQPSSFSPSPGLDHHASQQYDQAAAPAPAGGAPGMPQG